MGLRRKPFVSKKVRKQAEGKCRICGESNYALLDVHRIREGSDGGKYSVDNTVILCCKCHRLQQDGQIKILGWVNSTAGRLVHWFDRDGNENFS